MRPIRHCLLLGLPALGILLALGAVAGPAGVGTAAARPAATFAPTATPTPDASPPLCTVTARQTADRTRIERGQTVELTLSIAAECPVQAQGRSDIMLVVDMSASMADAGKYEAAKAAVAEFVDDVDFARHQVGLVLFNVNTYIAQPLTNRGDLVTRAFEAAGRPTGGTNIAGAIAVADQELALRGRTSAVAIIVLMTDGKSEEAPMIEAARAARRRGTVLFAIGLGQDAAQDALRRVASSSNHYAYAPSADALADIYAHIAAMIRAFVVTDVWLYDRLEPATAYLPGSAWPDEPQGDRELAWRWPFVVAQSSILSYQVRVARSGRLTPSERVWADFTDGDGVRRRVPIQPVEIEVVEPEVHTVHLPIAWRHQCVPTTQWADIAVVLDVSSSMQGDKLAQAVAAAKTFVGLLERPGNQATIVAYDEQARMVQPLTTDLALLEGALDGLVSGQGTRIDRGIEVAVTELTGPRHRRANRPVIVLLSDGRQVEVPETALTWAEYAAARDIVVFTIALGADADRSMLATLAGDPSRAYVAPGAEDLAGIYTRVAGAVRCR